MASPSGSDGSSPRQAVCSCHEIWSYLAGAAAYDGYLRAVSQIIKNESAWALWSGWKPTLLGREQSIGRCVYVVFEIGLAFVLQAGPKEALNLKHSKFESSPIPNANATLNQACTSFRISHREIKTKHES